MDRQERESLNGHSAGIFWFSGLSGAGKTTVALEVERELVIKRGMQCVVLDGDRLRQGLNRDLGFTVEDRHENLRRVSEVGQIFLEQGFVVLVPMITPCESFRSELRDKFLLENFAEVYIACALEACEQRDPKGLYRRARKGEIQNFTGIDASFEIPLQPDIIIDTEAFELKTCTANLLEFILTKVKK